MVNLGHKLTVDDLIMEYMIYKTKFEYDPYFTTAEFMNFLRFFETKMEVEDVLYEQDKLFNRFFARKNSCDWSNYTYGDKKKEIVEPHMDMIPLGTNNEYIISANYKLSAFDESVINTYFMGQSRTKIVRKYIEQYLSGFPKRQMDMSVVPEDAEVIVAKYIAAEIVKQIWSSYVLHYIKLGDWPQQCTDISEYLLDIDLAKIIKVKSIKDELMDLYENITQRIAIMYHNDKNLQISSFSGSYLAKSNYDLLTRGYNHLFNLAYNNHNHLQVDLSKLILSEMRSVDGIYDWDEDIDTITYSCAIDNVSARKLALRLDCCKTNDK